MLNPDPNVNQSQCANQNQECTLPSTSAFVYSDEEWSEVALDVFSGWLELADGGASESNDMGETIAASDLSVTPQKDCDQFNFTFGSKLYFGRFSSKYQGLAISTA